MLGRQALETVIGCVIIAGLMAGGLVLCWSGYGCLGAPLVLGSLFVKVRIGSTSVQLISTADVP